MTTIDQNRVTRILAEGKLRSGAGRGIGINGAIDACVMQAVDYITGGNGTTYHPECADPVITRFCIRLNDSPRFAQWRDELKPYIVRIAGTRADRATMIRRSFMCADWAIRTIAPLVLDFWADTVPAKRDEALSWAKRLRELPAVTDGISARFRALAQAAFDDAAAYAYAYAADRTAAAAADRSKAEVFLRTIWEASLAHLDALIRVTEPAEGGRVK